MRLSDIVQLLDGGRWIGGRYQARCPAHEDSSPSLSLSETNERVLVFCHAGCSFQSITAALGINESDWFDDPDIPSTVRAARDIRELERKALRNLNRVRWHRVMELGRELRYRDQQIDALTKSFNTGMISEEDAMNALGECYRNYSSMEYEFQTELAKTWDDEPKPDPMTEDEQKAWMNKLEDHFRNERNS